MSAQLNEPRFVRCPCQHCNGGIEFDANQFKVDEIREIECPHCNYQTMVFAPVSSAHRDAKVSWLKTIVRGAARKMGIHIVEQAIELIACCSLEAPMDTIRRLQFVANFANVGSGIVTADAASAALQSFVQQERASAFADFVGQDRIKKRIQFAIDALERHKEPLGHILLVGKPGFGKTTLASLLADRIANAIGTLAKSVSFSDIRQPGDLAGILTNLEENDLLFVDNIDFLPKAISEHLESALVDFKLDIIIDRGANARSVRLNLPHFTLIATATDKERLSPMLRACFAIDEELDSYSRSEIAEITRFFERSFGLEIEKEAADLILDSAGNTPKNVLDLMRHIRVYARAKKSSQRITSEIVTEALKLLPAKEQVQQPNGGRQGIPSEVRREVWRRDGGVCVKCGSRENLEYDHIIPVAKGGSNTTRNIELLCEVCNRAKSDSIQ